ncbi:MAG: aldo/keto reductase [Clostridia bacterium]|nr:aldo/keto reductase [Clostridia bacterium]
MRYRALGSTGLTVSEIGLGCEWLTTPEQTRTLIHRAEALGVNILDCWMSDPAVRSHIGAALEGRRDKWIIQGHIGSTWQDGQYVRSRKISEASEAFEDMLRRFRTDYIDLGMIHYVDDPADWQGICEGDFLPYVQQLKKDGRIRHIGLSTHNPEIARLAAESGVVEMIMFSVNPAFDMLPVNGDAEIYFGDDFSTAVDGISPERIALYKLCEQRGVGITVMKGFAGGRLFDAERSPFGVALTPAQCLHYCLTRPAVASVLAGVESPAQLEEAAAYHTASSEAVDYATVLAGAPRHAYTGQCTYCGHCKPCPVHIDIAMVNKLYDLALMQPEVPDSIRGHYRALQVPASACIGCGSCESRCPFGVAIAARMASAAGLLE